MKRKRTSTLQRIVVRIAILATLLAPSAAARAQEAQATEATTGPTPTPQPTPMPAADIPNQAAAVGPLVRNAIARTDVSGELKTIARDFAREREHLAVLTIETARRMKAGGPASIIEEAQNAWVRANERLQVWLSALKEQSTAIEEEIQRIAVERQLWELTQSTADEVGLPEALRQQVAETLASLEAAETAVRANRDAVLTLQSDVAREKAAVDEMLSTQKQEIARRRRGIVGIDSTPLWKLFVVPGIDGGPSEELAELWSKSAASIRAYMIERQDRLALQALFLVFLAIVLVVLRRRAELWSQQDRSLRSTVDTLERPFAAAFIVTMLLGHFFHPRAPRAWLNLMGLVILLAVLRILPKMLPVSMKAGAYLLALIYFLQRIMDLAPDGTLIDRLTLFLLALTAAASSRWLLHKVQDESEQIADGWRRVIIFASRAAILLFLTSAMTNLIGAVGLSTMLIEGTLTSIYAAILFWVAAISLQAMVRVALLTPTARRLGVVRLHADTVRRSLFQFTRVVAVIGWVVLTMRGFALLDPVVNGLSWALESKISIGDLKVVPADIVIFILVVWLAFKISRLLRFVLETDVMARMDLPRGVPGAIDRLSHYAIVVVGVMIAASAAGLDFSRINLIIGALGVGIGFGLQNVVNNFVSGLILLFERPIRIGDKLQLGQFSGTVKDIGMRASIVRTWDGAEVIVPNASLISSEVINWTLSDERRRMEISIGVAYGTDPRTVIDLLLATARGHPEVLTDPEPNALFLDFGESSLDFKLRAWTGTDFVRVGSELRIAVSDALAAAGVEIAFPQRDLHLRSVDLGASEALREWGARKRDEEGK